MLSEVLQADARTRACDLANVDPVHALEIARGISDPWYACQAFAWVGRFWPGADFRSVIAEGARAANRSLDPYQVVAAAAWPVRAFLERDVRADARMLIKEVLPVTPDIENLGSRSEALFTLLQAALPYEGPLWRPVLIALIEASEPTLSWRQRRNLRDAASMVFGVDSDQAKSIGLKITSPDLRRIIEKVLASPAKTCLSPRQFFWDRPERPPTRSADLFAE